MINQIFPFIIMFGVGTVISLLFTISDGIINLILTIIVSFFLFTSAIGSSIGIYYDLNSDEDYKKFIARLKSDDKKDGNQKR